MEAAVSVPDSRPAICPFMYISLSLFVYFYVSVSLNVCINSSYVAMANESVGVEKESLIKQLIPLSLFLSLSLSVSVSVSLCLFLSLSLCLSVSLSPLSPTPLYYHLSVSRSIWRR